MAQQKRTYYTRSAPPIRRTKITSKRVFSSTNHTRNSSQSSVASTHDSPPASRRVFIPLINLRRLPSRPLLHSTESMRDASKSFVHAGTKRKRSVSGVENVTMNLRVVRGARGAKRHKPAPESSDEEEPSAMEVDEPGTWVDSDGSDNSAASSSGGSFDEFYFNEASSKELLRLRKDELVRLYSAAGLSEDPEHLTKNDIVEAIISARDDIVEVPPSSPSGFTSSDGSSDDGHFAGGEETDIGSKSGTTNGLNLRRRATVQTAPNTRGRPAAIGRTMSLGQIDKSQLHGKLKAAIANLPDSRLSGNSNMSSPSVSTISTGLPSPPVTRQRSRNFSATQMSMQQKGKGKQVEFSRDVEVVDLEKEEESDLTDLTELEIVVSPSPRRLRSKGEKPDRGDSALKRSPKRKPSGRLASSQQTEEEEDLPEASEDECDELLSSPNQSVSDPHSNRGRRTPVKHRLRSRPTQTHTPPSDGDDEEEDEDTALEEDQSAIADEETDESVESTPLKPRRLRNGKVVTGESITVDEDESVDDEAEQQDDAASVLSESTSDVDAQSESEGEVEDEDEEAEAEGEETEDVEQDEVEAGNESIDDFDLSIATTKALTRLRRDDLVKMCETREIDVSGTKAQLAKALLQWRDQQSAEESCPSSTGTARPPETTKARVNGRKKSKSKSKDATLVQPPATPPTSNDHDLEPEMELDLESLGLHDREIPPDKITKLEKIGSGGFKDVFVGKLKGRKVAIAEFRGQLNAMDVKELKLLGDFSHPNIVRFLGVSIPENTRDTPVMIISELCSNGDLFDYIRSSSVPAMRRIVCMMLDIARGIHYLHTHKPSVIHRDCKSSNILITSKGVAKITDFGLAKVKQSTRSMVRSLVGTVNWQAPELWHPHPKYNHKVDVFSCAMVFWEMLQWHLPNKKFPWEGMNEHAIYDLVGAKRQRPSTAGLRKQWNPEVVDLVEKMWAQDHQDRPTMEEVVSELEDIFNRF